jgi:hypothetical protein
MVSLGSMNLHVVTSESQSTVFISQTCLKSNQSEDIGISVLLWLLIYSREKEGAQNKSSLKKSKENIKDIGFDNPVCNFQEWKE